MIHQFKSAVIVTEDLDVINTLSNLLIQLDYSILIEKSKMKSISKILESKTDLVFLDIGLSHYSILDLINIIKLMRPRLPIIVLSDDNSTELMKSIAELGILYCALKPIQQEEMQFLLSKVGLN
ncbi:response regulator [candidate division KSB1 bacterium]|nr:response regulator [candidate division KSB1 bacterium]